MSWNWLGYEVPCRATASVLVPRLSPLAAQDFQRRGGKLVLPPQSAGLDSTTLDRVNVGELLRQLSSGGLGMTSQGRPAFGTCGETLGHGHVSKP